MQLARFVRRLTGLHPRRPPELSEKLAANEVEDILWLVKQLKRPRHLDAAVDSSRRLRLETVFFQLSPEGQEGALQLARTHARPGMASYLELLDGRGLAEPHPAPVAQEPRVRSEFVIDVKVVTRHGG